MPFTVKTITSLQNEEIKHLQRLVQSGKDRRKEGVFVLEGIHLVESCQDAALPLLSVYINEAARNKPEVGRLLARLGADSVCVYVPEAVLAKATSLSSAPELIAVCRRPQGLHVSPDKASCVVLEDIQDPGNLGTILRCAAASGVWNIYLSKGCVDVFSPKVLRAGMGAHFALNIHEQADLPAVLGAFPGKKLVTSLEGSVSLYQQELTGNVAFVFGNEGAGVSEALMSIADTRVLIPMPGQAESLNVAMAATVCLFERVRQLQG